MTGLGCVIALPLAWYLTNRWLSDFTYRINIEWWMLAIPGIVVSLGTLFTISILTVRAALVNPVKTLKE